MSQFLSIQNVSKQFGQFTALNDISLSINKGELICFLGPSGCGKTTLLRMIAGLESCEQGRITQAGVDITRLPPEQRDFGIVFQSYALFPNLTVFDNIAIGLQQQRQDKTVIKQRVNEWLSTIGLPDAGSKYPGQLSGGQQQRVALARALILSPGLLLLDEPLSALDAKVRVHLRDSIRTLQKQLGITTIMVTHDQEEAMAVADRIVVMNHGVIEQMGTPQEIYQQPASRFVAEFIGAMNFFDLATDEHAHVHDDHDTAVIGIRPEDIQLTAPPLSAVSNNLRIPVRIDRMEFQGTMFRVECQINGAGNKTLRVDVPIHQVASSNIAPGANTHVWVERQRMQRFYREATP